MKSAAEYGLFILKFFWLTGVVVALTNIIGLCWFGNPERANKSALNSFMKQGWPRARLVVVFVSRGDNATALTRSIVATEQLLMRFNITHRIDVVTDMPVEKEISQPDSLVKFHLVPSGYTTVNQAKWKARALHYVVEQHRDDELMIQKSLPTWVLHLDEESQLTESAIAGIAEFINNPTNSEKIGQGEIKYNAHNYGSHLLLTWADSIRSGDDLGRFRFQYTFLSDHFLVCTDLTYWRHLQLNNALVLI
jgi:hypothetical protein